MGRAKEIRKRFLPLMARIRLWVRRNVPRGMRWPIGLVMIFLGLFSFLPLIGIWMIPLGILIASMDLGPAWRKIRRDKEPRQNEQSPTRR